MQSASLGRKKMTSTRQIPILDQIFERSSNNFDFIRVLAALGVIFGHSFAQQKGSVIAEPTRIFFKYEYIGSLSVYAFFLTSGMLVTMSFCRTNSPLAFLAYRMSRIWPAAIVASVVTFAIFIPLSNPGTYFDILTSHPNLVCMLKNALIIGPPCTAALDFFKNSQAPFGINWALWTLPLEINCYLIVLTLGLSGLLSSNRSIVYSGIFVVLTFCAIAPHMPKPGALEFGYGNFQILGGYSFYPIPVFFCGMILYGYRGKIRINPAMSIIAILFYLILRGTQLELPALYIAFFTSLFCFAASKWVALHLRIKHDYSYGLYIYGFPVGQAIAVWFPGLGFIERSFLVFATTLLCAALSWHLVEKPAMRFVRARVRGRSLENRAVVEAW